MKTAAQHFQRAATVFVRNNGEEEFSDRFDGEDFSIPPGAFLEMPPDAAKLCLGFGEDDKHRAIRRLGWAHTENDMKRALARLNSFSFHGDEADAAHRDGTRAVTDPTIHLSAPVVTGADPDSKESGPASGHRSSGESLLGKLARAQETARA